MNTKTIIVIITLAFAVSLVLAPSVGSVFADKNREHDENNQATSQANACGNGQDSVVVFCGTLSSQTIEAL